MNIRLTVLLPVHNGEEFLREAIDSILSQTFHGFLLLVINDGSKDRTANILQTYSDPRIRVIHNSSCLGIVGSLNLGLKSVTTEYVARMDADDIAHPERFSKQVDYLDKHADIGVCGTQAIGINSHGRHIGPLRYPCSHHEIIAGMLLYCPILHPSAMMRTSVFSNNGIEYSSDYPYAEDYALWHSLSTRTRFHNLPDVLLFYRQNQKQVSKQHATQQAESDISIKTLILDSNNIPNARLKAEILHFSWFKTTGKPFTRAQLDTILQEWIAHLSEIDLLNKNILQSYIKFYCQKCRELDRIFFPKHILHSEFIASLGVNRPFVAFTFGLKVALHTVFIWIKNQL